MACSGVLRDARSESSAVRERRSCRAFGAALAIASRLGVGAQRAVGLAVWNKTIIGYFRTRFVAKIRTSHFGSLSMTASGPTPNQRSDIPRAAESSAERSLGRSNIAQLLIQTAVHH